MEEPTGLQRQVFEGYQRLLKVRTAQRAFHPAASMEVLDLPGDGQLGWIRQYGDDQLVVLANLSPENKQVPRSELPANLNFDQLAAESLDGSDEIELAPFQVRWIT